MVAAGPPAVLCVTAIVICKAMAGTGCGISSLSPQCPGQCSETAEGPPARVVAAGPPAVLCVTAIVICKAMAGTAAGFPLSLPLRCITTDGVRFSKELTLTKFVSDIDTSDVLC